MHFLFYAARVNRSTTRLNRVIEDRFPDERKDYCPSVEDLALRLRRPMGERFIGLFLIGDAQDLADLQLLRDDLRDVPFILVLPDTEETTLSRAHALGPRYIGYADGDFLDVAAVMERLMKNLIAREVCSSHG